MAESRPLILRLLILALVCVLVLLQARLWVSDDGFLAVQRLRQEVELQRQENRELERRNERLAAEVVDLRKAFAALEERARSDLGLIAPNETFYVIGKSGNLEPDSKR